MVYGKDTEDGKSIFINTAGSVVHLLGKDNKGRSIASTFYGGVELVIGSNLKGESINLYCRGNVNMRVDGDYTEMITGRKMSIVLGGHYQYSTPYDLRLCGGSVLDAGSSVNHFPVCHIC